MKTITISLLIIIAVSISINAQDYINIARSKNIDAYEFPIKPGTPEWGVLSSHTEMLEVCQIPEQILSNMSTEGLILTCLNYPMSRDMLAFKNLQYGVEIVISNFNGLRELLGRPDRSVKLLEVYRGMNPEGFDQEWTLVQKGKYAFEFVYIEILLSQDIIISNLKKSDKHLLLRECLLKFDSKQKYHEVYGIHSLKTTGLIIGRIVQKENFKPFKQKIFENEKLKVFLQQATLSDIEILNEIIISAQQFLLEKKGTDNK